MISRAFRRAVEAVAGPRFVPLTAPLTSASWSGSAYSTVAVSTQLDLSAVFGVPAGVQAVLLELSVSDSAAWGTKDLYFVCGPSATYFYAGQARAFGGGVVNNLMCVVPCDANGDVWYQIVASGVGTMNIGIRVWGYWQ